jgi:hypothetical protein
MTIDLLQKAIDLLVIGSVQRAVAAARFVKECESLPFPSEK